MKTCNFDNWTFINIERQNIVVNPTNCYKILKYSSINFRDLEVQISYSNAKTDAKTGNIDRNTGNPQYLSRYQEKTQRIHHLT